MKTAILYICTGKYVIFWKTFYESCELNFLPETEKHYFVFTDADNIDFETNARVHKTFQEKLGWPYDTLMRFDIFLKREEDLKEFDFICFINANMVFKQKINLEEILPTIDENGLLGTIHPFFIWVTNPKDFPYERNKKSYAYIKRSQGRNYFMGGFNGGLTGSYLNLIKDLQQNVKFDLDRGIIAKWHDESHLNKYFLNKKIKELPPIYGCPEGMEKNFPNPKIIILDKNKFGGHLFLRETNEPIPEINNEPTFIEKWKHRVKTAIKSKLR